MNKTILMRIRDGKTSRREHRIEFRFQPKMRRIIDRIDQRRHIAPVIGNLESLRLFAKRLLEFRLEIGRFARLRSPRCRCGRQAYSSGDEFPASQISHAMSVERNSILLQCASSPDTFKTWAASSSHSLLENLGPASQTRLIAAMTAMTATLQACSWSTAYCCRVVFCRFTTSQRIPYGCLGLASAGARTVCRQKPVLCWLDHTSAGS